MLLAANQRYALHMTGELAAQVLAEALEKAGA